MTADALPELDPFADDFQQAPFVWYARLREQAPVYRVPGHDWLRFKGSSQHRLIRDVTVADIGKQVLLALLGCSSLVRLLPERRLGQGSAVAEPRSGAQHP